MCRSKYATGIAIALLCGAHASHAGLSDWLEALKPATESSNTTETTTPLALSQAEMVAGLKQALDQGVQQAVEQLGRSGGFLDNPRVHIPMPEELAWMEKSLRSIGQHSLADEFVTSMNRAAERAVPEVAGVFTNTIKSMTLDDAQGILNGPDDAATRYFQTHSSAELAQRMRPIVSEATSAAGVTGYYKAMMQQAGGLTALFGSESTDLDGYVTQKAMDGLFLVIGEQEKKIRENPVERSTELLQKVFGSIAVPD